ncbi:MAG TPA: hypothetical protein PLU30_21760 [Verrucomicrobiae bacterium]|nr:hypothetical protein [Verrucomicrobiae bacterium]
MSAHQDAPPGWDAFLARARLFFGEGCRSTITQRRLMDRFGAGALSVELFDIFDHLIGLAERYHCVDWWGRGYRPLFRHGSPDEIRDFIPLDMRRLARRATEVVQHTGHYVHCHRSACTLSLTDGRRDMARDTLLFGAAVARAERGADWASRLLDEALRHTRAGQEPPPAWAAYLWLAQRAPRRVLLDREPDMRRLWELGALELRDNPHLGSDVLATFGLAPPAPGVLAELARLREEVAWADRALAHLGQLATPTWDLWETGPPENHQANSPPPGG